MVEHPMKKEFISGVLYDCADISPTNTNNRCLLDRENITPNEIQAEIRNSFFWGEEAG